MITPIAFNSIKNHTYTVFAVINAFMVPCVYFFYPETAYRSLEEMDSIFHKVKGWQGVFTVVHQAKIEPRRYGKNGELLIDYNETEEHRGHIHPHGSDLEKPQGEQSGFSHAEGADQTNSASGSASPPEGGVWTHDEESGRRKD